MTPPDPLPIDQLLRHDRWLRALASSLARPGCEADDLVQEAWLAALRRPLRAGDPRGWLRRVTENSSRQARRSALRRRDRELGRPQQGALELPADEALESLELRQMLLEELAALDERDRTIVALRFLNGLSLAEVARRLEVPRETIKSQQARALERLRIRLDRRMGKRSTWMAALAPALFRNDTALIPLAMSSTTKITVGALAVAATAFLLLQQRDPQPAQRVLVENADTTTASPRTVDLDAARKEPSSRRSAPEAARLDAPPSTIELEPILGQVVDIRGQLVPGATVHVVGQSEPAVVTDALGAFEWQPGEEPVEVTASASGYAAVTTRWLHPVEDEVVSLVLAPAIDLSGVVVDRDERPVQGARLSLVCSETWSRELTVDIGGCSLRSWRFTTDDAGHFAVKGVAAVNGSLLWVKKNDETSLYGAPEVTRHDLRLYLFEESEAERWATTPHMKGRVVDPDGNPLEGVDFHGAGFSKASDALGRFRFPLSALAECDELHALCTGNRPQIVRRPGPAWPADLDVVFELDPAGVIHGVVLGPDGEPLPGRDVWLAGPTPLDDSPYPDMIEDLVGQSYAITDDVGEFELTALSDGLYSVIALDRQSWARVESHQARAGSAKLILRIPTPRPPGTLVGRVIDLDRERLASVTVTPRWTAGAGSAHRRYGRKSAQTDAKGCFRIESLPAGFDVLSVRGPDVIPQDVPVANAVLEDGVLVLTLPRRARIKVSTSLDGASHFMLYANGKAVEVHRFQWVAEGTLEGRDSTCWPQISEGASAAYTAAEGRYELRLFVDDEPSRRVDVNLVAGELREVAID